VGNKSKSKGKSQKAKGKSLFGSKAILMQISKSHRENRRIKKKESADLLPFAICLLPFDLV
jgi:hypothetical protein